MATTILDTFITLFEYKVEGLANVEKAAKIVGKVGDTLTRRVTAPVIAGFAGMIAASTKFEDGLDNVLNLLDAPQVDQYSDALDELQKNGVKAGFSLNDVNKALFDNVSALGLSEKSMDNFEVAQRLAIAGNADLGVAIDGQTSVINAYGKEFTDATDVANAFFTAQKAGKTTVAELASNVGKVAPLAKQAGIGFDTLLASMSQLTLGGLSTEESATALRGAIAGLLKPTDEAADLLEDFGIPIGAAELQTADFTEVLQKLAIAAEENPDAMAEMFPNIRALTAISAIGEAEVDNLRNTVKQMGEQTAESSFMLDGYNRRTKNAANSTKKMWGELQVAAKVLGDHLLPVFIKVVNKVSEFFAWLEKLSPETQRLVLILMAVAATIGPVLIGISKLMQAFIIIKNVIAGVKIAMAALNVTMLANPIGLVIAAIAALVGWFLLAFKATGSWQGALKLMGAQIISFGQRLLKFMLLPMNMMVDTVIRLLGLLSKIPGAGKLKDLAATIKEVQGTINLTTTGSSSVNPFATREQDIPFSTFLSAPIPAQNTSTLNGGSVKQDNRQFNIQADLQVNEASDGEAIAAQLMESIEGATRDASQDFQTSEAG